MKHWCSSVIAAVALTSVLVSAQQAGREGSGSNPSTPKSDADRPLRVRVSQTVSQAFLVKKVQPRYPDDARRDHVQGDVVLKVEINTNGDVEDATLVSGDPALVTAAVEAVKQWKYKPYLLNGRPANVETQVTVAFRLSKP